MFGRLGTGSDADELVPVQVNVRLSEEKRPKFVGIAAGAYHSLALAGQFNSLLMDTYSPWI